MLRQLFTSHPADVGENYFEHFRAAAVFSAAMFIGAFAFLVHALVPGLFVHTGSGIITQLHEHMVAKRRTR